MEPETKEVKVRVIFPSGEIKEGKFVLKIPTYADSLRISTMSHTLTGGLSVPSEIAKENKQFAALSILLLEKPDWFDLFTAPMSFKPLIEKLYSKIEPELEFFRPVKAEDL